MPQHEELRKKAIEASKKAYAPYSKPVGCCLVAKDGQEFNGCNVDNISYGATICAERTAIFKAISEGTRQFGKIYIYSELGWSPCGICRQVLAEFADPDFEVIIGDIAGTKTVTTLGELFPSTISPKGFKN